jgi:hypothetical protein
MFGSIMQAKAQRKNAGGDSAEIHVAAYIAE